MKNIWKVHKSDPRLQSVLSEATGVSPSFAQLLINRGIKTPDEARKFLFGDIASCHDPYLMKDMGKSRERIRRAVERGEKILVYGDYDADGVTATAVMSGALSKLGADFETFIPNRLEEGYGMNVRAVAYAREKNVKLIITVDCGINSFKEVACANEYGIDVIITDHHEIKENDIPEAYAVIDAHQKDCAYPYKELAGVGVAYKLASVLLEGSGKETDSFLDLVALGTIADIAPLSGENRLLVKAGLGLLKKSARAGLKSLAGVAGLRPESITSRHVGFALAPRINAVGRTGSAGAALELLLCEDTERAIFLAELLDKENRNRQAIEKGLLEEAVEMARERIESEGEKAIVLARDGWHAGVLGIAASRLTEEFNMPAILIALDGDRGKGSGRSVDGLNLFESVKAASAHLLDFGGHESACGLRIARDEVDNFRKKFNAAVIGNFRDEEEILPELKIDMTMPFSKITVDFINELALLAPHGPENPEPVFETSGLSVKNEPRRLKGGGLKFLASLGNLTCEAVSFARARKEAPAKGAVIDLAYTPSLNGWQGIETIQLNVKDVRYGL